MVFGDFNDPGSAVSMAAKDKRNYRVLEKLNTTPSIVYLSKVEQHG